MNRYRTYPLILLACAIPRVAVLLHARGRIVEAFTEKSWDFAQTFVASGTFGFIPGVPSASTQPLYGFFLVPVVWAFGTSWLGVGLVQILVAVASAVLVYEIGFRVASRRVGLAAAVLTTLHPYLIWHDVHLNREILDQLIGAALVLAALTVRRTRSLRLAGAFGVLCGLAILANTRLILLPLLLVAVLTVELSRRSAVCALVVLATCVVVVAPWVVRNRAQVGCFAITTDAKALWKANNTSTYDVLAHGGWIDEVPNPPGAPKYTPEFAGAMWAVHHQLIRVNECAQMRFYEHLVARYWTRHPGGKARLAAQATAMLWSPTVRQSGEGTSQGGYRRWVEMAWALPVFVLAAIGVFLARGSFRTLAISLLAYETAAAWVFAGTTRYRVAWDFVLALLAAIALDAAWSRWRPSRSR